MGLLFLVESPDKDPYYYYLYCLIVPIFILGFISSLVTFAAFVLAKSSMQSRVYNLLATIVFLNMIWSLFNVVTYLISLYYNSEFFSRLNESSNPVWLEIVLWFNVVLAMERYFHVCGVGPRLSRIWFVVGLASCFLLIGLIIWNQSTVEFVSIRIMSWKYIIPSTLIVTSALTFGLYSQTYWYARKVLSKLSASREGGDEYVRVTTRRILSNSVLMTLSFLVFYIPQIVLMQFGADLTGQKRLITTVFVNALAGLDPLVTALLAVYFVPNVKRILLGWIGRKFDDPPDDGSYTDITLE